MTELTLEELAQKTVLFVDDEENILKSIHRGLLDEPYKKRYAHSGLEALDIIAHEEISVLVTDMRMPEMDGLSLLQRVQEEHPEIVRIILTGYSQISTLISAINTGQVYRYLTKPWRAETEFIPAVRQAIAFHHLRKERDEMVKKLKASNLELNKKNIELNSQIKKNETLLQQQKEQDESNQEILLLMTRELLPYLELVQHLGNPAYPLNNSDRERMTQGAVNMRSVIESINQLLSPNKPS